MPSYATPEGKFNQQRLQAKQRGIDWLLTFDEWWGIWQQSGKWNLRGKKRGQFVMSRVRDVGPYSVDNVRIVSCGDNHRECVTLGLSRTGRINSGSGKYAVGWTLLKGNASKPYMAQFRGRRIGCFATQAEAEAAYAAAVQTHMELDFHGRMVFRSPKFQMATDSNTK